MAGIAPAVLETFAAEGVVCCRLCRINDELLEYRLPQNCAVHMKGLSPLCTRM